MPFLWVASDKFILNLNRGGNKIFTLSLLRSLTDIMTAAPRKMGV